MKISRLFACLLALCAFGCGDDSPTAPTNLPGTPITELFIGTLPVGGSSFYSIGFPETTTVRVTLIALSSATGVLTPVNVSLRLGVPSGTTCAPTSTQDVTPAFTQQIAAELAASTYCVGIADTGSLTQPTNFLIRINQIPGSSRPPIAGDAEQRDVREQPGPAGHERPHLRGDGQRSGHAQRSRASGRRTRWWILDSGSRDLTARGASSHRRCAAASARRFRRRSIWALTVW